jgi:large subunit ribosomal protein L30
MDKIYDMAQIKVKQVKSSIKRLQKQKRILESLGLRGIGKEVTHDASPSILGMVEKVKHLVSIIKL